MQGLMVYGIIFCLVMLLLNIKRETVYEYEKALKYSKGKVVKILEPGRYWIFSRNVKIVKIDIRPRFIPISGQEVLSADGVTLKTSIVVSYQIKDPFLALVKVDNYQTALYTIMQMTLREIIGEYSIEDLMSMRSQLNRMLMDRTVEKVMPFGLALIDVGIRDIMFPGELKKIFSQVIQAKKEGLAALEKARGESAALRNLANAAKVIEQNPSLMKLKLLQSTGNTFIFDMADRLFADERKLAGLSRNNDEK